MKSFWLTFIILILVINIGHSQFQERYSLFERTITLEIDSTITTYNLPDSFLIKDSEYVWLDSLQLTSRIEYVMEYTQGRIKFLKILTTGQQLRIYYRFLPLQIQRNYFHRELLIYQPPDSGKPIKRKLPLTKRRAAESASSLKQNGSIVRGISIGTNQELKLESGLRMQISGKIADKLEVVAALTDQNTPIQPEGNTQTLQEIDKVFIQLKSDQFQATLGDYYLSFEGTEFSAYNRKLQGVMGTAELGKTKVTLSGAVSRGKFTTNYFSDPEQEGNQGPYQLKGDRGQIDIIVLAGTEKVWIDGQLMTRGENNDYIIEYSNGQITFTRHRLITADSRITVDFQYSDQKFQRSLYGVDLSTQTKNEKLKLGMRLLRESDNKNNPLDYSMTDENRSQLQLAGDNPDSAYISGENYLGPGKGNYVKVDSAGITFYRYVGPDSGYYNIAFSYVGKGNGSYNLIEYGKYEYKGQGNGYYNPVPVIFLTPPESHDLVDMELAYHPWQNFQINSELALSRLDKNLFSSKDDGDNSGLAMSTRFGLKQQPIKLFGSYFGKFNLNGKYRRIQQQFQYIDRSEEVEKNRKWDLTTSVPQREEIVEFQGGYSPVEQLNITGSLGENRRGENFFSRRWELGSEISFKKIPQLRYRIESIDRKEKLSNRTGNWVRQYGNGQYQFWKLWSTVDFQAEEKQVQDTLDLGFRFYEVSPSLKLADWKKMSITLRITRRQQDKFEKGEFRKESEALTQTVGWQLKDWKSLSLSLEYTHRKRSYADTTIGAKLTDLADFRADYSPLNRAIITNWHYQLSNTQVVKQERIYIKVERGQGNYRFDEGSNDYVYDPSLGDYILRIRATDEFIPVIELRASSTIKFRPELIWKSNSRSKSFPGWKKWLSSISTETFIQLEEKTKEPDVWSIYRLELSQFQQDSTMYGTKNFRQDLYWGRNDRKFSLRLRYNERISLNNQYLEGKQGFTLLEREVRIKSQLSQKVSSQLNFRNRHESKRYTISNRDKNIFFREADLDISYRPRQPLELAVKSRWAYVKNRIATNPIELNFIALTPRINYSFRGKGRLRAELEFNQVAVTPKNAIVPYEMASGNRDGTNLRWIASFDYNVSRYLRASFSWNGHYYDYLNRPIYTVRAEMRAYF